MPKPNEPRLLAPVQFMDQQFEPERPAGLLHPSVPREKREVLTHLMGRELGGGPTEEELKAIEEQSGEDQRTPAEMAAKEVIEHTTPTPAAPAPPAKPQQIPSGTVQPQAASKRPAPDAQA